MFKNLHRQVTVLLYKLKRNFGRPIIFRKLVSAVPNVTTGKQVQTFTSISIQRAVVMPYSRSRDFIYDLTFVAANKNFAYGAFFDKSKTAVIVEKKDLGSFQIEQNDDLVIDGRRYQLINIEETEGNTAYLVTAQALKAEDTIQ